MNIKLGLDLGATHSFQERMHGMHSFQERMHAMHFLKGAITWHALFGRVTAVAILRTAFSIENHYGPVVFLLFGNECR
jgi:hypothetical protein